MERYLTNTICGAGYTTWQEPESCRKAVHDFRESRGISEPILDIDGFGVYWRKERL
jgi:Macrocin-O-methyltransferase (TylF)